MKGVHMLLELDHGHSTAKVLWMLYQVLHIIPKKERDLLLLSILGPRQFYGYMFHWSWNVRQAFHYLFHFQLHFLLIGDEKAKEQVQSTLRNESTVIG